MLLHRASTFFGVGAPCYPISSTGGRPRPLRTTLCSSVGGPGGRGDPSVVKAIVAGGFHRIAAGTEGRSHPPRYEATACGPSTRPAHGQGNRQGPGAAPLPQHGPRRPIGLPYRLPRPSVASWHSEHPGAERGRSPVGLDKKSTGSARRGLAGVNTQP